MISLLEWLVRDIDKQIDDITLLEKQRNEAIQNIEKLNSQLTQELNKN